MFVVLGASGNTGKVVAETLLRQRKKVRVVLHDAAKGKAWGEAGADVAIADVDEGAALERAFSGAEGVYVLLPPNFSSSHARVDNNRRTNTIAAAVEAAGVPHVVLLSSVGAQQSDGTGPVLGLRDAETVFSRAKAAVTFVRAAYLMENWGGSLYAVEQGVLPTFLVVDKAIPMVTATSADMTMQYLDVALHDLQREFELARSKPRHLVPQPRVPSAPLRAGLDGLIDSLLAAQHLLEMFRRALPDGTSRRRLARLSNRLTKIVLETRKLRTP